MSKRPPRSKPIKKKAKKSKSYIQNITRTQIILTICWMVLVVWIVYGSVQLDQLTVIGVLVRLIGLWLLQTGILTIFGLLEILFQQVTGLPILGSRSITGGKGINGLIKFCIAANYAITLVLAFATLMRYF